MNVEITVFSLAADPMLRGYGPRRFCGAASVIYRWQSDPDSGVLWPADPRPNPGPIRSRLEADERSDETGEILPNLGAGILASGVLVRELLKHVEVALLWSARFVHSRDLELPLRCLVQHEVDRDTAAGEVDRIERG